MINFEPITHSSWFCYWQIPCSQWDKHIESLSSPYIMVPIYWGHHHLGNEEIDLGQIDGQNDLKRIIHLGVKHHKSVQFILSVGPSPLFPNGGIPVFLPCSLSLDPWGRARGVISTNDKVHKIPSFYSVTTMKAYWYFLERVEEYFKEINSEVFIYSFEFYSFEKNFYLSFLEDSSEEFEKAFSRYLKNQQSLNEVYIQDVKKLKIKFIQETRDLLLSMMKEIFGQRIKRDISLVLLGASGNETIERSLHDGKSYEKYLQDIFSHISFGYPYSTFLLTSNELKDLQDTIENLPLKIEDCINNQTPSNQSAVQEIEIFINPSSHSKSLDGLDSYLIKSFPFTLKMSKNIERSRFFESNQNALGIFRAELMEESLFNYMLKCFLAGKKILFDRDQISEKLLNRLSLFIIENKIKKESIRYHCQIDFITHGSSMMILYQSNELSNISHDEQLSFWNSVFNILQIEQPLIEREEGVFYIWENTIKTQPDMRFSLNRTLRIFNPTNQSKKLLVKTHPRYAFCGFEKTNSSQIHSQSLGVELILSAKGKAVLDYGVYRDH